MERKLKMVLTISITLCGLMVLSAIFSDAVLQSKVDTLASWLAALVCLVSYLNADIIAKKFLYTPFEKMFGFTPEVENAELHPRLQPKVNETLTQWARRLGGWYAEQEVWRQKAKSCNGDLKQIKEIDSQLSWIKQRIEETKTTFYSARDIAVEEGFIAFESYRPYEDGLIIQLCIQPDSQWFNKIPTGKGPNEKGGYSIPSDRLREFLEDEKVNETTRSFAT